MSEILKRVEESVEFIRNRGGFNVELVMILGSGLGHIADSVNNRIEVPYGDIPHFPVSTVEGHAGKLVFGKLRDKKVAIMQGRFHYYEGYTLKDVVYPLRVLFKMGMKMLIVTNAAGGTNPNFDAGDIMLIVDHINLMPDNPLRGANEKEFGPRFPAMSRAYSPRLIEIARRAALESGVYLKEGVYVALQGPSLETPAEYNFVRLIGGDAVGMSTVPEVIAAVHMGVEVAGFSIITNALRKSQTEGATHDEVLSVAEKAGKKLSKIILKMLEYL